MNEKESLVDILNDGSESVLIVMVGPPGSGKSTLAQELSEQTGLPIVSTDSVRKDIFGDEKVQDDPEKVFERVYGLLDSVAYGHGNVIYDATNCNPYYRKKFVKRFKGKFDSIAALCYDGTLDVCLKRNNERERVVPESVVKKMFKNLTNHGYPAKGEGFDHVLAFSDARDIFHLSNGQVS